MLAPYSSVQRLMEGLFASLHVADVFSAALNTKLLWTDSRVWTSSLLVTGRLGSKLRPRKQWTGHSDDDLEYSHWKCWR